MNQWEVTGFPSVNWRGCHKPNPQHLEACSILLLPRIWGMECGRAEITGAYHSSDPRLLAVSAVTGYCIWNTHKHTCTCMCEYGYASICIYKCMHICMHNICLCVSIYICVCIYVDFLLTYGKESACNAGDTCVYTYMCVMFLYVCVCFYVCMQVCVYIYVFIFVLVYVTVCIYECVYMHLYMSVC